MSEGSVVGRGVGEGREECSGHGEGEGEGEEERREVEDSHFVAGGRLLLVQSPVVGVEYDEFVARVRSQGWRVLDRVFQFPATLHLSARLATDSSPCGSLHKLLVVFGEHAVRAQLFIQDTNSGADAAKTCPHVQNGH